MGFVFFMSILDWVLEQLRNAYHKLEADLKSNKKRLSELIAQRDNLKEGREESVRFKILS